MHKRTRRATEPNQLDAYWNGLVRHQRTAPERAPLDPAITETTRLVHRLDDAPAPNPAFLSQLREDLMDEPSAVSYQLSALSRQPSAISGLPARNGRSSIGYRGHRWCRAMLAPRRWWPALEFGAALIIIFSLVSVVYSGTSLYSHLAGFMQTASDPAEGAAMVGGNAARTGEQPGPGIDGGPSMVWQVPAIGDPYTTPVVLDDTVYLAGSICDGEAVIGTLVAAYDAKTGVTQWEIPLDAAVLTSPAVAGNLVFVGANGPDAAAFAATSDAEAQAELAADDAAKMVALNAATGEEVWRTPTADDIVSPPAVANGMVYVNARNGTVHAFDTESGTERWRADAWATEFDRNSSPGAVSVADGVVYAVSSTGGLYALDAETGDVRWDQQLDHALLTTPVVAGGMIFISSSVSPNGDGGDPSGILHALATETGDEQWQYPLGHNMWLPVAAHDGTVYVPSAGTDHNELVALEATSGEEQWSFAADAPITAPPALVDDVIYVVSEDSGLYALDAADGTVRWVVRAARSIEVTPAVAGGAVYVVDRTGMLYRINGGAEIDGTPVAMPIIDGDISGLPACDVEPRPLAADPPLVGTPAATLAEAQLNGSDWLLAPEDVPAGEPADEQIVAALTAVLAQMYACDRPGLDRELAGFYTDDYFRRPENARAFGPYGDQYYVWAPGIPEDTELTEVRVLADGRIGGQIMLDNGRFGFYLVFIEQEGRWLIDEFVNVVEDPAATGRG